MDHYEVIAHRLAGIVIGITLSIVSVVFAMLGVTFLPVVGIFLAIPIMGLAVFFLNTRLEVTDMPRKEEAAHAEENWPLTDALAGKVA